ncbi:MAG: hypothetical protein O7E52_19275 [Candidatus Poribacteria bacterium]|nr:hypothetical protein [Candidatus Poribacteria bacterium]
MLLPFSPPSLLPFFFARLSWLRPVLFLFGIGSGIGGLFSSTHAAFEDGFIGARAFAMGGAFTAIGNESDGLLVNPASISSLPRRSNSPESTQQLSATMATLYVGLSDETSITQNLVSYANSHVSRGAVGLLWKRLNVSELYSENYVVVGVSKNFELGDAEKRQISLGGAVKWLNWDTSPTIGANGTIVEDLPGRSQLGVDVGVIFRPTVNIPIALSLQNLNTPNIASTDSGVTETLPLQVTLGIGILGKLSTWGMDLVFKENQVDVKVGIEYTFDRGRLLLRGGFRLENLAWGTNLTLGGGYRASDSIRVDYGFLFPIGGIEETFGSHRFSIVYDF